MRRTRLVLKESVCGCCFREKKSFDFFCFPLLLASICAKVWIFIGIEGARAMVSEVHGAVPRAEGELGEVVLGRGVFEEDCGGSCQL